MFGYITQKKKKNILEWFIFEIKVVPMEWIGLANKGDKEMDRLFIHPYTHDKIFFHISKNNFQCGKKYYWRILSTSSKDF